MALGHKTWVFPDGEMPPPQPYDPSLANPQVQGHESLIILNSGAEGVVPRVRIYFEDKPPQDVRLAPIPGQRVFCYRLDRPIGTPPFRIPPGQYGLIVECDHPVVAQFGRMDVRQPNLAYYTVMGFPVDGAVASLAAK